MRTKSRIYKTAVIKFLYNDKPQGENRNMTNFPYLSTEAVLFLRSKGFKSIAVNTPSFDNEASKDLENHHAFFKGSNGNLLIELIDASKIQSGPYIADISIYPVDSDAAPCVLKLSKIVSGHLYEKSGEVMSEKEAEDLERVKLLEWSSMKHQGTVQTDVYYPISSFVFDDLKYNFESEKNGLKIVNFGWGKNNT